MAFTAIQSSFGLLRWPFLVTPRPSETGGQPKFACTFVAGGPNGLRAGDQEFVQALMKQMDEACVAKWNVGVEAMRQRMQGVGKLFNLALKRNSDPARAKHAGIGSAPQGFHFEAKTQYAPDYFDPMANKMAAPDPTMFYDGAVVRIWVSAYAYEHPKSGPGIGLNLNGLQFVQHAPRLGGVEVKADAVNSSAIPNDLPTAAAPVAGSVGQTPGIGQPGGPPGPAAGASYGYGDAAAGTQQQQPPAGASYGFGF